MQITYVSNSTLFSGDANAVHVACMCDAFAGAGHALTLTARRVDSRLGLAQFYGLEHRFEVRFETRLTHKLWLAARALRIWHPRRTPTPLYYGRNLPSLRLLGGLGFPAALELHYLPRPHKLRLVRQLIGSRGFVGLVVISEQLKRAITARLPQLPDEAILVAHDGFRADSLRPPRLRSDGSAVRAVYAGSFHRGKGVDTLIAAARRLPEIEFEAFGGTPEQMAAAVADAPPNLHLHGRIPHAEIAERLRGFDIALAPYGRTVHGAVSNAIGQSSQNLAQWMSPLKLFEYAAAGLPIITSNLPAIRELLVPEENALMVPPDDVEALSAAIRRLATDPDLRLRLAQAASRELSRHTWDRRAAAITDFLQRRLQALPA